MGAHLGRRCGRARSGSLTAAAVLGPDAELRHAAVIAGLETELAVCLVDGLVEVGLLRAEPRLSFAHPVVSTALDSVQPAGQRATRHLRAAELLAEEDASAELVAAHVMDAPLRRQRLGRGFADRGGGGGAGARRAVRSGALPAAGPGRAPSAGDASARDARARSGRGHSGRAPGGGPLADAVQHVHEAPEGARAALETGRALFALGKPFEAMGVFERGLDHPADGDQDVRRAFAPRTRPRCG